MTVFRIRPAPIRAEQSFTLENGVLSGPGWQLPLNDVTDAIFVSYRAYGRMIWRLDLKQADITRRINTNLPAQGGAVTEEFAAFHGLVSALVAALDARQPGFQVGFGEHGIARHAIFGIGLISVLGGAGIGVAALSGGRGEAAAVPVLLLMFFGAMLIRANAPWQKPPRIDAGLLPPLLTHLAGGNPAD